MHICHSSLETFPQKILNIIFAVLSYYGSEKRLDLSHPHHISAFLQIVFPPYLMETPNHRPIEGCIRYQLLYKAYLNGYKLLVDYNTGIQHLDGKAEHQTINKQKLIDDTAILLLIWHRTCYQKEGVKCIPPILRKIFIMLCARLVLIIPQGITPLACCVKGLAVGMKISKSQQYRSLHTFVLR